MEIDSAVIINEEILPTHPQYKTRTWAEKIQHTQSFLCTGCKLSYNSQDEFVRPLICKKCYYKKDPNACVIEKRHADEMLMDSTVDSPPHISLSSLSHGMNFPPALKLTRSYNTSYAYNEMDDDTKE